MATNPQRPRPPADRKRFSDPAAEPVYQGIVSLDPATQHELLRRLQVKLHAEDVSANATQGTRVAHALTALREAQRRLGHSPSVADYRQLYREGMRDAGWPDERCVRRWLGGGSWNDALRRAHLEPRPDGDVVTFQHGPFYSREELVAALRECRDDLGHVPSFPEYIAWVNRPDVHKRPGRRPRSIHPIQRLVGSWLGALRAAELVPGDPDHGLISLIGLRRAEYRVSDEALRAGLREVAKRIGRSPRVAEYTRERTLIYEETAAAGTPRALPGYATFNRRFRQWDDALVWAGLEPLGGRGTASNPRPAGAKGPRVRKETIRDAIRDAYQEEGEPFTVHAYRLWREEQIDGLSRWELENYPSYHTIWARYGSWAAACNDALGPPWDEDEDKEAGTGDDLNDPDDDDPGGAGAPAHLLPRQPNHPPGAIAVAAVHDAEAEPDLEAGRGSAPQLLIAA
jgi:hypothetical protein